LREFKAWASGLRREQSQTRAAVRKAEEVDGRIRISPLADWNAEQVDRYIQDHGVPVHPLYLRGYTSIGCAPCTRAVEAGEDERAGRWWWEEETRKECGIHFAANGTVERDA
jgi:phosphoadenylyl-sulfate reductase (thioredoxin)